jgi:hypothetical protein
MPIINMKNNIFNYQKDVKRDSSAFSNKYENLRYDSSPTATYLNKTELGMERKGD